MSVSWEPVVAGLGSLGGLLGIAWAWVLNQRKRLAETRAVTAESGAAASRAEANAAVFDMVKSQLADFQARLSIAENRIDDLRQQVMDRDSKIHSMELYVMDLEKILLENGITPPARQF